MIIIDLCLDGPCVQADGTSWSMILNGTLNNSTSPQSDLPDNVNDVTPSHSAASSLPVVHGTVLTPADDRHHTTSSLQSIKSNDFSLCHYLVYFPARFVHKLFITYWLSVGVLNFVLT